ncbi:carbonate dehydratase, partial [Cupriavidus sp. SK-4]|uniref:carbonate dehydratase n=1 Tax=Cupriavidus sp. SK-4 TaxID=574750 RepID=UPI000564E511
MSSPPVTSPSPSASLLAPYPPAALRDAAGPAASGAGARLVCFHCGLPVTDTEPLAAELDGNRRGFC